MSVNDDRVRMKSLRMDVVEFMRRMTVGPCEADEVIPERASDRYHIGMLFPAGVAIDPEEDDFEQAASGDDDDSATDDTFSLANAARQGAAGFTVLLAEDAECTASWSWATYEPQLSASEKVEWRRSSGSGQSSFRPSFGPERRDTKIHEEGGVRVVATTRIAGTLRLLTLSVINGQAEPTEKLGIGDFNVFPDRAIYQVELRLSCAEQCFDAQRGTGRIADEEFENHELLYRHARQYAVGHGCAVNWSDDLGSGRVSDVWLEWMPATEVFKASTAVLEEAEWLSLHYLANSQNRTKACEALRELPRAYLDWVGLRQRDLDRDIASGTLNDSMVFHARKNLEECRHVASRVERGIEYLAANDLAWRSFYLANEAAGNSMIRTRPDSNPRWRAFQLAFILICLPSTAEVNDPDRDILELIWFSTGGGKTEAYLGLALFCLFHRRLRHKNPDDGSGTAILTRYTLRLLTIQQFERAARAVLAAELLRRKSPKMLGDTPFTVGLYVGNKATPGTLVAASKLLSTSEGEGTTLPLSRCPWCSAELTKKQQSIDTSQKRLMTKCASPTCDFRDWIPISVVDEEIYEHPPSMVVATLDKFAMMAWNPEARALFGKGKYSPPELIIQDELHLIGDALGTIAALYEISIDRLCRDQGRPAKIIGSTATIRRANKQVSMIFDRRLAQFPPNGIDSRDSYFSKSDSDAAGRLYVGVHAQGRSPKHTLARVMGLVAQAPLIAKDDEALADQYFTQVAYFNSLRELGGAIVLAEDDTRQYIASLPERSDGKSWRRPIMNEELTSQRRGDEIPILLRRLAVGMAGTENDEALDLVFATNMISVGVDVDRLGVMVLNGQPKTTAEYIQASSRVGRPSRSAGLVVTVYNWTRPRDRSHYERFRTYHESFYRFVEATSVTPFADRALDRAMPGAVAALVRQSISELAPDESAVLINEANVLDEVRALLGTIADRAESIAPSLAPKVREYIDSLVTEWMQYADGDSLLWKGTSKGVGLLIPPNSHHSVRGKWKALTSMRDVEPSAPVRIA